MNQWPNGIFVVGKWRKEIEENAITWKIEQWTRNKFDMLRSTIYKHLLINTFEFRLLNWSRELVRRYLCIPFNSIFARVWINLHTAGICLHKTSIIISNSLGRYCHYVFGILYLNFSAHQIVYNIQYWLSNAPRCKYITETSLSLSIWIKEIGISHTRDDILWTSQNRHLTCNNRSFAVLLLCKIALVLSNLLIFGI